MALAGWIVYMICAVQMTYSYSTDDIVDLTRDVITNKSMHWMSFPYGYEKLDMMKARGANGIWGEAYGVHMSVHSGTHMDAPCHFFEDGQRMHEVPLSRFFGPAAVVDVKAKVDENSDYELTMDDLNEWEEKNGVVPDGAIVLIHTGWYKFNGDAEKYWGTADHERKDLLQYPGIRHEAATFLVEKRNINALGIDSGSPDSGRSCSIPEELFQVHLGLLGESRLIIENIGSALAQLPPTGYNIHAIPMKLHDTCGAPVRLLAFKTPSSASGITSSTALILVTVVWMLLN